ncbi:MAG: carboxypeptidase regulatory-like domain-containing protein, partial [Bacteroidetes bacterium]|nr:carboxypeptidase regulatory-like domain-containing protein [Bacteroidota bacterium]
MKGLFILALLLTFYSHITYAQKKVTGAVKGKIADSTGRQDLSQASVSVTLDKHPESTQFVVTGKSGAFMVRSLKPGDYSIVISFEGYAPIFQMLKIDTGTVDLGTLYLQKQTKEMATVIVEAPPMKVKGDTVEYNASMYGTKPNAVAEDLLKKFPGIQVDASGNITAQGETVQRVLVNGKRFFSDDPKLATRNLPPDIIDKIQVFDDLDDQSKFSGFDDGNRVKTINITTKKDKRMGYFG